MGAIVYPEKEDPRPSNSPSHSRSPSSSSSSSPPPSRPPSSPSHITVTDSDNNGRRRSSYVTEQVLDRTATTSTLYLQLSFSTELPPLLALPPSKEDKKANGNGVSPPNLKRYISPYKWPLSRKAPIMVISCVSTMFASFAAGSYGPAVDQLVDEFKVSTVAIYIGITMFTAGFAVGPMPLSPFSEFKGRKPVFVATAALFLVCQVCTAVTRSYPG